MTRLTKIGKFYISLFVFWFLCIIYIAFASIPFNPLSLWFNVPADVYTLVPEGWGFFTRNPSEPTLLLYTKGPNDKWVLFTKSSADISFGFGVSRKSRKITGEAAYIKEQISDTLWISRPGGRAIDFNVPKITLVTSGIKNPILLGDYIMVMQDPIPWAWSSNYKKLHMPYKIARVHILKNTNDKKN